MGKINNNFQTETSKTHERFGKNYFNIDFDLNDEYSKASYENGTKRKVYSEIGSLVIGDTRIKLTEKEIEKVMETLYDAREVLTRKYSLGMLKH